MGMASSDYCWKCSELVLNDAAAVERDGYCQRWFHIRCGTGIDLQKYKRAVRLFRLNQNIDWVYASCELGENFDFRAPLRQVVQMQNHLHGRDIQYLPRTVLSVFFCSWSNQ